MQARYPGTCAACGRRYPVGTHIRPAFGKSWQHSRCPLTAPDPEPEARPVIPIPDTPCYVCHRTVADTDAINAMRGWVHRGCLA